MRLLERGLKYFEVTRENEHPQDMVKFTELSQALLMNVALANFKVKPTPTLCLFASNI